MIVEAIIEGSLDDVSIDELRCLSSIVDDAHHHAHDTNEECYEFWCTNTIFYLLSEANRKWKEESKTMRLIALKGRGAGEGI